MRVLIMFALASGASIGALAPISSMTGFRGAGPSMCFAGPTAPASAPTAASPAQNSCGCYEDSGGICRCAKKSQCGCPGECEPAGCEEKRQKQLAKETEEELKRQQQEDKKRNAELAKKQEELDRKDAEKRERGGLRGLRLIEQK